MRATHLGHKPGLSTTGALLDAADGAFVGWFQSLHDSHPAKVGTAVERAAERGMPVQVRPDHAAPGVLLVHGSIDPDARLCHGLSTLATVLRSSVEASVRSGRLRSLRWAFHRQCDEKSLICISYLAQVTQAD